jgi:imidazole glycerol-phosphate synthase subunit HisH
MPQPSVVVLDYGSGNVHSASKALEAAGAVVTLTADRHRALEADGLVVPGVGAFSAAMTALKAVGGQDLVDQRLARGRPVLGICVGMQVLFEAGVEGGVHTDGLGQWPGTVTRLHADVLPHMGWNTVDVPEDSTLFAGVASERFYFVHSFAATAWQGDGPFPPATLAWSQHGTRFLAAVESGPLSATQFHPEKSGEPGIRLLSNWVAALRKGTR